MGNPHFPTFKIDNLNNLFVSDKRVDNNRLFLEDDFIESSRSKKESLSRKLQQIVKEADRVFLKINKSNYSLDDSEYEDQM